MMDRRDGDFFVGWSAEAPRIDRRFMLGAGLALVVGAGGAAAALGGLQNPPGDGAWDQGEVRSWTGVLLTQPYPLLRTLDIDGAPRTAFLATTGKSVVRLPNISGGAHVSVRGSLIHRGRHAMLAVVDTADWLRQLPSTTSPLLHPWPERDLGDAMIVGEILDAKCWFGAMRPGYGKTHKACAALCARGGLPLAFCAGSMCGDGDNAPLLLNEGGGPHTEALLPFVADPVRASGRLVQVGDVTQFRVSVGSIARV